MIKFVQRQALRMVALAVITTTVGSSFAMAQAAYPSKPITLVVTYPPGGGADAMARLIGPKMGEALGQSVVIENKPGRVVKLVPLLWPKPRLMAIP